MKKWFKRCGQWSVIYGQRMMPKQNGWTNFFVALTKRLNTIGQHHNPQWGRAKFYGIRSRFHEFFFLVGSSFHRSAAFILITLVLLLSQTSFLMLNSYNMFQSICMSASCSRSADLKRWKIILPHDFMMTEGYGAKMITSYECHIVHCSGNIKLIIYWTNVQIDENKSPCGGPIFGSLFGAWKTKILSQIRNYFN